MRTPTIQSLSLGGKSISGYGAQENKRDTSPCTGGWVPILEKEKLPFSKLVHHYCGGPPFVLIIIIMKRGTHHHMHHMVCAMTYQYRYNIN